MFQDIDLQSAMETQYTLNIESLVLAEFNLNDLENIDKIGNYKWRPTSSSDPYHQLPQTYDPEDVGTHYSDAQISYNEYKLSDTTDPFQVEDKTPYVFYSLGDCFLPFRPRSGINKARFISGKSIDNLRSAERPRYYIPSSKDYFKYWSSYRKDGLNERGISFPFADNQGTYTMEDSNPFVIYKNEIATNRIVVKMQTNVGNINIGSIRTLSGTYTSDPLFEYSYASVPKKWRIQTLNSNNEWTNIITFNHNSKRSDLSPIVPKDGHVELFYGIVVPNGYLDSFEFLGYINQSLLPDFGNLLGDAYVYGADSNNKGTLAIWDGTQWDTSFTLEYGWSLLEDAHLKTNGNCKKIVNPLFYDDGTNIVYREFDKIKGLRVVVETMNFPESCFDLIELSPRLSADISDYVNNFSITKTLSSSNNGLPVGELTASNGTISLSNMDNAFNSSNTFNGTTGSIIYNALNQNIKFMFYEKILNINGYNKYIPIKTMYSDRFTKAVSGIDDVSIPLRDLFFRLETAHAPSVLSKDTRLTYAVAQIMDFIGFSNYVFKTVEGSIEPVLPYFFVEKGASVAEILQRIAIATQSAMFFDEYNNFVVMTKEYLLSDSDKRGVDLQLSGNDIPLPNIESITPQDDIVLNSGIINYTVRYIQREIATLGSSIQLDNERSYKYKPVLLWEVSANEQTKTINESTKESSGFALGAMALNSSLSSDIPTVVDNQVINNIIDFGESIYWLPRYQGYLYANGEIIRFDAVEYSIPGSSTPLVWITSNQEYQKYFANLRFNGKIFPTGKVRIYSEPYYETVGSITQYKNGAVKQHGRSQFGTEIANHPAGLSDYWSDNNNVYGVSMKSSNIFTTTPTEDLIPPALSNATRTTPVAIQDLAKKSARNGIIKNFMSSKAYEDGYVNKLKTTNSGTIQSSALVMRGPRPSADVADHRDLVSFVYKDLSGAGFKHYGTRMRIIGKSNQYFGQMANGAANYYALLAESASDSTVVNGGSGGMGIFVDPSNGSGYYFEIIALSADNIDQYIGKIDVNGKEIVVHNILFYKINSNSESGNTDPSSQAIPQKLWGGLSEILVDGGLFAGQDRLAISENNTTYDLSVEYVQLDDGSLKFYLYINNVLVKVVKDSSPLPIKQNVALFTRASSECMFENVYAIEDVVVKNGSQVLAETENVFDRTSITTNEFMKKYAISGMIQSSYLTNISPTNPLKMRLYFEEFGTIMRECVHFNIEYDKAYPAFFSRIAKTFTSDRSFTVSGFYGGPYESEFLVFNSADKAIVLDDSTGSYLRILGITFTQNSTEKITVDDFYKKLSNFSNPQFEDNYLISPEKATMDYNKVKASRSKYGNKEFSLDSMYVQSEDQANEIMKWMINKTLNPRKNLIMSTYPMPHLQLGDIVSINYTTPDNIVFVDSSKRFIVNEITYTRSNGEITQQLNVVET